LSLGTGLRLRQAKPVGEASVGVNSRLVFAIEHLPRPQRAYQRCPRKTRGRISDVLTRIADHPTNRLADLLPWNWAVTRPATLAA